LRTTTLLLIVFLTAGLRAPAVSQQKSNSILKSVDIEFTYTADGKNIRKTLTGFGEDPGDGLYKPEKYDIVIRLNEGLPLAEHYVQVLIEENISPTTAFQINNERIPTGWVPVRTIDAGMASRAKKNMIVVSNPDYKLAYDPGSILYTRNSVRLVVLCKHQKTGKITYIKKEYEYPM
jgi:hypothetical protein